MSIIINKRNGIDPAKISGPYSLLAVMLLVAEILFAIWFYKAQSSIERSIAGLLMAAVFITLMLLVMRMNQNPGNDKNLNSSLDSGSFLLADNVIESAHHKDDENNMKTLNIRQRQKDESVKN